MEMEFLFVILPVLAIVGGILGNERGRVGIGVLLSILLGPIGWAIVFFGPDKRNRCIHCKEVIQADAQVCRHCGKTPFITVASYKQRLDKWEEAKDPIAAWEAEQNNANKE